MFPIAVLIRGSNIFGESGEDVDLYIPYLASTSQVFKGTPMQPHIIQDGALDFEANEMGVVIRELASGNAKTLLSLLSPGQLSYTHWYMGLKNILQQFLSVEFAPSLVEYIEEILKSDNPEKYRKAARYIIFGLGYFKHRELKYGLEDEEEYNEEWCNKNFDDLKDSIEEAKNLEVETEKGNVKIYNHTLLVSQLVSWLMTVRSQVFKLEEM